MRFRKWLFKIDWSIQERWVELSSSVKTNNDSAIIKLMEQSRLSSKSVYWSQNGVYVQPTFKIKPRFLNEDPILLRRLYPESTSKLPQEHLFPVRDFGSVPKHLKIILDFTSSQLRRHSPSSIMAGLASLQKKEAREYWLSAGLENEINACVRIINNFEQTGGIVFPPNASVEQKTAAASACRAFQSHFYNFSTNYTAVRKYLESQTKDVEAVEYLAPKIKKTDAALANLTKYAPLIEKELQNFTASHIVLTTSTSDSLSLPLASPPLNCSAHAK